MDKTTRVMNDSIIKDIGTFRSEQFRVPSDIERRLGLWVDRIGEATTDERPEKLRILGQYCLIHVIEGDGVYLSQQAGRIPVRQGDCMIQFPEDPCLYYPHTTWTTRWVTWHGPESGIYEELGYVNSTTPVFPDHNAAVLDAHAELSHIIHDETPRAVLRRKAIVLEMIAKACVSDQGGRVPSNDAKMKKAAGWIHQRFAEDIQIPELASKLNVSVPHFRRLFRRYTGRSPTAFIRSLRISESKRLLLEGLPIKQVAATVGYRDVFYFMRVFKKTAGIPPGQFQNQTGQSNVSESE